MARRPGGRDGVDPGGRPLTVVPWKTDSKFGDCHRCGAFAITVAVHKCPPTHRVFVPDYSEEADAVEVPAFDAEAVALKYADRYDSDRHEMGILHDGLTVVVIGPDDTRTRFRLTGETVPSYEAEEVDDD